MYKYQSWGPMTTLEDLSSDLLSEVFPNPPLVEVAFEVRFAPLLKVERQLPEFQEHIASEYPMLGEEQRKVDNQKVKSFEFKTTDQGKTIRISLRSFSFLSQKYEKFERYKEELTGHLESFCDSVGVKKVTRVGLRYINNIRLSAQNGSYPVSKFVRPLIDTERIDLESLLNLQMQVTLQLELNQFSIRTGLFPLPTETSDVPSAIYLLDYDCYVLRESDLSEITDLLDQFHDHIQRQFLQDLTPTYIEIMRGKGGKA